MPLTSLLFLRVAKLSFFQPLPNFDAMRKIALTDIHGCRQSLEALLDQLALTTADELYFLGDYIDRGPDSKGVIDTIFFLKEKGHTVRCLMGNHEDALLIASKDRSFFYDWYDGWGGRQALESFGVHDATSVPMQYMDFFKKLEYCIEVDGFILVHAGLDFRFRNPLSPDINMLYLRDWYETIDFGWLGDRIIVHGHTPISKDKIETMARNLKYRQVLNIDGGCFAPHLPGKGHLCAFDMTNRELYFQKNLDDVSSYWKGR